LSSNKPLPARLSIVRVGFSATDLDEEIGDHDGVGVIEVAGECAAEAIDLVACDQAVGDEAVGEVVDEDLQDPSPEMARRIDVHEWSHPDIYQTSVAEQPRQRPGHVDVDAVATGIGLDRVEEFVPGLQRRIAQP
jgi:hypothetical protein